MLSSTLAAVVAPACMPSQHAGVGVGAGLQGTGMSSGGTCPIPGYPTVLRARAIAFVASATAAAKDNDVWGSCAWSPPV